MLEFGEPKPLWWHEWSVEGRPSDTIESVAILAKTRNLCFSIGRVETMAHLSSVLTECICMRLT